VFFSCSAIVDGSIVNTNPATFDNTPTVITSIALGEGAHIWNINCTDSGNTFSSEQRLFTVDTLSPIPVIFPPTAEMNNGTYQLNFTIFDMIDPIIDYVLYINGQSNTTGTTPAGNTTLLNLNLPEGENTLYLQGTDDSGNAANSTAKTITVDLTAPTVLLVQPINKTITGKSVIFKWNTTDAIDTTLLCDLAIDGVVEETNISSTSGTTTQETISVSSFGVHNWSVSCDDDSGNTGTSTTASFTTKKKQRSSSGSGGGSSGSSSGYSAGWNGASSSAQTNIETENEDNNDVVPDEPAQEEAIQTQPAVQTVKTELAGDYEPLDAVNSIGPTGAVSLTGADTEGGAGWLWLILLFTIALLVYLHFRRLSVKKPPFNDDEWWKKD